MLTILYKESREAHLSALNNDADYDDIVTVELRKWATTERCDVILHTRSRHDGAWTHDNLQALNGLAHTDAQLIRRAIRVFDALLAEHPVLGTDPSA